MKYRIVRGTEPHKTNRNFTGDKLYHTYHISQDNSPLIFHTVQMPCSYFPNTQSAHSFQGLFPPLHQEILRHKKGAQQAQCPWADVTLRTGQLWAVSPRTLHLLRMHGMHHRSFCKQRALSLLAEGI